jgi:DNA polymerase-3 subunit alpha
MVSRAITGGQLDTAWQLVSDFSDIFRDRYYLEVQRHGIDLQDRVNAELAKMAVDLRLPLLATNDAHYLEACDHEHHDALLCIGTATNLDDPKRFRFDGHGFYVKDGDEMAEVFRDHPSAIASSLEIAERCELELGIDTGPLPDARVPGAGRHDARGRAVAQAWAGLRARLGLAPDEPIPPKHGEYVKRMEHELGVITSMGFAGYFLIVADFIAYARATHSGRAGPRLGRGQPRGVVARHYRRRSDRVRHHLRAIPEPRADQHARHRRRLLHEGARPGDPLRRRQVRRRGRRGRRVAQIITFGKLQARAAVRDVGRVLGMPFGDVDRIAKQIPRRSASRSTRRSSSRPSCARGSTPTARCASCSRPRASSRASRATRARTPRAW